MYESTNTHLLLPRKKRGWMTVQCTLHEHPEQTVTLFCLCIRRSDCTRQKVKLADDLEAVKSRLRGVESQLSAISTRYEHTMAVQVVRQMVLDAEDAVLGAVSVPDSWNQKYGVARWRGDERKIRTFRALHDAVVNEDDDEVAERVTRDAEVVLWSNNFRGTFWDFSDACRILMGDDCLVRL